LRKIDQIYVVGQEEPKEEVYNTQSRQYNNIVKRMIQSYIFKLLAQNKNWCSFYDLYKVLLGDYESDIEKDGTWINPFAYTANINNHILKKIFKEINSIENPDVICFS
jgi:hypothetical protein